MMNGSTINGTAQREGQLRGGLLYHYNSNWTREEWIDFRQSGIGGSEISSVLGLNPYKSACQLFYEKIGMYPADVPPNMAMFMGNRLEDVIADLWQHWDGSEESMIENAAKGKTVRVSRRVNAYIVNPELPHLFASIDRRLRIINGKVINGVLECKTISGFAASMWESGIPSMYVAQLQQYLLITGAHYGEMAVLKDGRDFAVYPFAADEEIQEAIVEKSLEFWGKVEAGRLYAQQLLQEEAIPNPDRERIAMLQSYLTDIEPGPDDTGAYESFMKERYRNPQGSREGTIDEMAIAREYLNCNQRIKSEEEKKQGVKNKLLQFIGDLEEIDFGGYGKITCRPNKQGNKVLQVRLTD